MKESRKQKKRYMDTALPPKERAKALLEELSLEEKVAQLNCVCIFSEEGTDPEKIRGLMSCGIGAVSTLELRRMKTLGVAYTKGIQTEETAGRKADAVAKHFLAFHNSIGGIHGADSQTPERLLWEIYGKPFQAAISLAGLRGIMPCYCSLNGEPVSLSKHLLTDLLREEMGFEGLCVSDYGAIGNAFSYQHVGERPEETGWMALSAGMDMELPNPAGFGEAFAEMFRHGEADEAALDRAVLRVLT